MPLLPFFKKTTDIGVSAKSIETNLEFFKDYDSIEKINETFSKHQFEALNKEGTNLIAKISQFDKNLAGEIEKLSKLANAESPKKLIDMQNLQLKSGDWSFQLNKSLAIIATRAGEKKLLAECLSNMRKNNSLSTDEFTIEIEQLKIKQVSNEETKNKLLHTALLENAIKEVELHINKKKYNDAFEEIKYLQTHSLSPKIVETCIKICIAEGNSLKEPAAKAAAYKKVFTEYELILLEKFAPGKHSGLFNILTELSKKFEEIDEYDNAKTASKIAARYNTPTEKADAPLAAAVPVNKEVQKLQQDAKKLLQQSIVLQEKAVTIGVKAQTITAQDQTEAKRLEQIDLLNKKYAADQAQTNSQIKATAEATLKDLQEQIKILQDQASSLITTNQDTAAQVVSPNAPLISDKSNGHLPTYNESIESHNYLKLATKTNSTPTNTTAVTTNTTAMSTDTNLNAIAEKLVREVTDLLNSNGTDSITQARARCDKAIKTNPNIYQNIEDSTILKFLAPRYCHLNQPEKAEEIYDKVTLTSNDLEALACLVSSHLSSNNLEKAEEICNKIIGIDINAYMSIKDRKVLDCLAKVYRDEGIYTKSIETCEQSYKLKSVPSLENYQLLKEIAQSLDDTDTDLALKTLAQTEFQALKNKQKAEVYIARAKIYSSLGKDTEATEECKKAVTMEPKIYKDVDMESLEILNKYSGNSMVSYHYLSKQSDNNSVDLNFDQKFLALGYVMDKEYIYAGAALCFIKAYFLSHDKNKYLLSTIEQQLKSYNLSQNPQYTKYLAALKLPNETQMDTEIMKIAGELEHAIDY
ncbi:outer membrane factor lipoprotein domain-containing protein [Rickettsia endosymbiont of Oedothorax gibbosus]|uniref:hypothetical protein n=1 Tax=Rickettsia endosymbiont of Oedothorax gibbosus TaxID=931099 RepID=UPI002025192B|nr:hypothetical protein [Rickettsia endosymbiont of Oedothorax gibbosus]